jgi:hypothetical protein
MQRFSGFRRKAEANGKRLAAGQHGSSLDNLES